MYEYMYYNTSRYISIGGNAIASLRNVNVCAAECDVFKSHTYIQLSKRASNNKGAPENRNLIRLGRLAEVSRFCQLAGRAELEMRCKMHTGGSLCM